MEFLYDMQVHWSTPTVTDWISPGCMTESDCGSRPLHMSDLRLNRKAPKQITCIIVTGNASQVVQIAWFVILTKPASAIVSDLSVLSVKRSDSQGM